MHLLEAADAFVALVQAKVGDRFDVSSLDLAENGPQNAIWLGECKSDLPWASFGDNARNRSETMSIPFFVRVYREGSKQRDAGIEARNRCGELGNLIEAAIVEDPETPFELSGRVSFARVAEFAISTRPAENGWVAIGRGRVEAKNHH